eukprot:gene10857-12067_t
MAERLDGWNPSMLVNKSMRKPWTIEEDEQLRKGIEVHGPAHWNLIAADFVRTRCPLQCRKRWVQTLDPAIKIGPWTVEEDEQLRELVTELGANQWTAISHRMNGRTAVTCRFRWLYQVNPCLRRGNWTSEEDDLLLNYYDDSSRTKWRDLCEVLPGRSACDIRIRHRILTRQGSARERWTQQEDEVLQAVVARMGQRNWQSVADEIKGRTSLQCFQRWQSLIKASLAAQPWREEEDELLLRSVQAYGVKRWAQIATDVGGRTAMECRWRWKNVLQSQVNQKAWTAEEDALLLHLRQTTNRGWRELCRDLPGRNRQAIVDRCRYLGVPLRHMQTPPPSPQQLWSQEEIDKLESVVQLYSGRRKSWKKIATFLPGRTSEECEAYYYRVVAAAAKRDNSNNSRNRSDSSSSSSSRGRERDLSLIG